MQRDLQFFCLHLIAGCIPSPEDYGLPCRTLELAGNTSPAFCSAAQHILVHRICSALLFNGDVKVTHLPKSLQDFFHLLVSPEKIRQGFLHWVQIGQSLLLLHYELLNSVVGDRFLSLFILWKKRGVEKREVSKGLTGVTPLISLSSAFSTLCPICALISLQDPEKSDLYKDTSPFRRTVAKYSDIEIFWCWGKMWMYLSTDGFFTLNSAVPIKRQVLDFPSAWRCTRWRTFPALARSYLPLLINVFHLLAPLILHKQGTLCSGIQFFPWKSSVLPALRTVGASGRKEI